MKNLALFVILVAVQAFAQTGKTYMHTVAMNEKMFLQQTASLKETDFLSCVVQKKSLQNLEDIEISDDPFFVIKALSQIQSHPMTAEDLSIWLDLAHRVNAKDLSPQQQNFLKTRSSTPAAMAPHLSIASESVLQLINRYSGILLIDGKFLNADSVSSFLGTNSENSVHQWTLLSNVSAPVSSFGTVEEFQVQLQGMKLFTDQDPADFDQLGCKVHIMNSIEARIAEDQMTGIMATNSTGANSASLAQQNNKMYWILPVVAGVIGAGAYEMRNKNISVHMPNMSFH